MGSICLKESLSLFYIFHNKIYYEGVIVLLNTLRHNSTIETFKFYSAKYIQDYIYQRTEWNKSLKIIVQNWKKFSMELPRSYDTHYNDTVVTSFINVLVIDQIRKIMKISKFIYSGKVNYVTFVLGYRMIIIVYSIETLNI